MKSNKRIALLMLLFFLALCLHRACGQSYENRASDFSIFRFTTNPRLDGHSAIHFIGGTAGYFGLRALKVKPVGSIIGSTAFGLLYEIYVDGYGNSLPFLERDPSGADLIGDVPMHFLGACFGAITEMAVKKLTGFKGKVYVKDNKAYMVIPLN